MDIVGKVENASTTSGPMAPKRIWGFAQGFPNFFMLYGPIPIWGTTDPGHAGNQIAFIMRSLTRMSGPVNGTLMSGRKFSPASTRLGQVGTYRGITIAKVGTNSVAKITNQLVWFRNHLSIPDRYAALDFRRDNNVPGTD